MFLSTKKEFYKLSSGVIFGSPTLHPTTQGFSSSLPITYLILLFPLLPLLFRLLHLFFFLITQHSLSPPNCCQLTFSNTTSILPSLYLQGWGCSPLFRMVFQFLHDLTSDYFSIRISHCSWKQRLCSSQPGVLITHPLTTKPLWVKCLLCVKYIYSFNTFTEYLSEQDKTSPCPQKINRPVGHRGKALRHHGPSPGCFQSSSKTSYESRHPWGLNSVAHTAIREGVQKKGRAGHSES